MAYPQLTTAPGALAVPNFEAAYAAARALDAAGTPRGDYHVQPLLGVPMTITESFDVAGLPTTRGHARFKDRAAQNAIGPHWSDLDRIAAAEATGQVLHS